MWMDEGSTSSVMVEALFVLVATREEDDDTRALRKRPSSWRSATRLASYPLRSLLPERSSECIFYCQQSAVY